MTKLYSLAATGLTLVALYLILERAAGTRKIISSLAAGTVDIYRTLQGR